MVDGNSSIVEVLRRTAEASPRDAMGREKLPGKLVPLLANLRPKLKAIAEAELPQFVRSKLEASDLVQETLLRAFRELKQFNGSTDAEFVAWLREILRNQIVDATRYHSRKIRDSRREQPLPDVAACGKSAAASELARRGETSNRVRQAVANLPEHYRTVILLRQEEDLTFEQIGERIGKSADATRMLWGRAILHLGKSLQSEAPHVGSGR